MNVRPTLICFFFLSLQDGNSGLAKAQISVYRRTEGEDIRVTYSFYQSGTTKFFCKNECKQGDLLIETTDVTAQNGRYGIKYEELQSGAVVSVSISQLTRSDSGLYRCGLGSPLSAASYRDFEVIVVDALLDGDLSEVKTLHKTTGGDVVVGCYFSVFRTRKYFCKEQCEDKDILVETSDVSAQRDRYSIRYVYVRGSPPGGFVYVTISQLTRSDSGLYRCGLDRPLSRDPYREFRIVVTDGEFNLENENDYFCLKKDSLTAATVLKCEPNKPAVQQTHT
ncbi:polymeric immunoglobulin receptor-like [Sander lucioperca]|uniref:polymeric immunoglobulin receptor-like n=1 Tax=Sander lucioperca TaxID=283035 RepID=UPI001653A7E4|nr:polymeric immunoglobulin receptor-like [Sander lucioperca]